MATWNDIFTAVIWMVGFNLILTLILMLMLVKYPKYLVLAYNRFNSFKLGLTKKYIQVKPSYSYCYYERGEFSPSRPSLLLVHGFSSSKDSFLGLLKHLPKHQRLHVVALDLPGHGESDIKDEDLNIMFFVRAVHEFVNAIGFNKKKFHILGCSMGGHIAGMYAIQYPEHLSSAVVACPHGISFKKQQEMIDEAQRTQEFSLLPKTTQELDEMFKLLSHKKVVIPDFVLSGILQLRLEKNTFYRKHRLQFKSPDNLFIARFEMWLISINLLFAILTAAFLMWNPKFLWQIFLRSRTLYFGFSKKEIQCNGLSINYIERGHSSVATPSILFIHGYTLRKEVWIDFINNLPQQMHVIALDLPGHGESEYKGETMDINFYIETIKTFVDNVGLSNRKFHVIGESMGGYITGMYAHRYPDDLQSIGLICPIGIWNKHVDITVQRYKETGKLHLLPTSTEEMQRLLTILTHKPVPMPDIITRGIFHSKLEKDSFYRKVLTTLSISNQLEEVLPEIKTPTLVLWGKQDQLAHVESTDVLEKKLQVHPKKLVLFDNVGHLVSLEAPKKAAEAFMDFIQSF